MVPEDDVKGHAGRLLIVACVTPNVEPLFNSIVERVLMIEFAVILAVLVVDVLFAKIELFEVFNPRTNPVVNPAAAIHTVEMTTV